NLTLGLRVARQPAGCVGVTQWPRMRFSAIFSLVFCGFSLAFAQTNAEEGYRVYTESPRLLLRPQRLRLLKRESERKSMRWEQFNTLIAGGARMPEQG